MIMPKPLPRIAAIMDGFAAYAASAPIHKPSRWPRASDGRYRVACYSGNFERNPVIYTQAACFDHRTLKAAARRLASLIARQGASGYHGTRYDSLYIVTPSGERLALSAAKERIKDSANG